MVMLQTLAASLLLLGALATEDCGAGVGDLRELAASKSACDACHGILSYNKGEANGLGYTRCSGSSTTQPQQLLELAPACGEGVGDLTQVAASQSACEACSGMLVFGPLAANGLGYTACVTTGDSNDGLVPQEQKPAAAFLSASSREFKVLLSLLLLCMAILASCRIARRSPSSRELAAAQAESTAAAPSEKPVADAEDKLADLYTKV